MPVVRAQRQVSTAPIPGVRKAAAETPASTGVGLEQARANRGEAIAGAGGVLARVGAATFAKVQQEERDKADQVAGLAMDNAFATWESDTLYNPQTGALTKKGKDALGLPEQVAESFTKKAGEIEATIGNERQRAVFNRIKAQRQQGLDLNVRRHVFQEMQTYGREELAAKVENAHNGAIAKALDPDAVAMEMSEAISAIKEVGPKLGLGPAAIEKQVAAFQSKTIDGVITRLFANGLDRQAKAYFEDAKEKGLLDGAGLAQIEAKVKAGSTDANGERAASAIWDKLGPATDSDPISIDKMEDAARAQWGDDTDSLKATIAALRSRKQGVADGRRDREDATNSTIWGAVFEGRSLSEIRRMPEFINAPGEVRTRIGDYFENEAARNESRAAARESRAAAAENRAVQADFRRERELELKGWSNYLELSDPTKLRAMTRGDILKRLPELGQAHVNRLLNDQEKLSKDDAVFRAAVIDRDLFNEVMHDAGVPGVYAAPGRRTSTQKANLGKLQATIEDEIARKQVAAGRRLTREETETIARQTVDAKVMIKDAGWFYLDEAQVAAVVNPKDAANAYVPIGSIPPAALGRTLNLLRSSNPAFQGLTDEQLKARTRSQLEASYAAYLLGLGEAEVMRRLGVK